MAEFNLGSAVQDVLTKGLDYAATIKLQQLRINDPTTDVQGYGGTAKAGQAGGFGTVFRSVPPAVWVLGGLGLVAAVFFLRRK